MFCILQFFCFLNLLKYEWIFFSCLRLSGNSLEKHINEVELLMIYNAAQFTSKTASWNETVTVAILAVSHFNQISDEHFIGFNWILTSPSVQHSLMDVWFFFYASKLRLFYLHENTSQYSEICFSTFYVAARKWNALQLTCCMFRQWQINTIPHNQFHFARPYLPTEIFKISPAHYFLFPWMTISFTISGVCSLRLVEA